MHPTSGSAFGYPTSGAGYGGEPPPPPAPPPRRRNIWIIPLVTSTATLVLLVAAIIVVLARRGEPAGGRTGGQAALVDQCVVGTWTVTRYIEQVPVEGVGDVTFTGRGAEVRLRADGTGVTDYRDGTAFTATISGVNYRLVVTGRTTFGYGATAGAVTFTDVKATGKETITRLDTGATETTDLAGDLSPATYTCTGDSLVETTSRYRSEMSRVSRTA
jgi:hypothetical protein